VIETQDSSETELVPIEDIGIVVLDHQQITITQAVASIHLPGFGNLEGVALTC
jgi:hypothetical protein